MNPSKGLTAAETARLTRGVTLLSIIVALVLVAIKAVAWRASGSVSLLASMADSGLDLLASLVTFFAVRYAAAPPDAEHRFGRPDRPGSHPPRARTTRTARGWAGDRRDGGLHRPDRRPDRRPKLGPAPHRLRPRGRRQGPLRHRPGLQRRGLAGHRRIGLAGRQQSRRRRRPGGHRPPALGRG